MLRIAGWEGDEVEDAELGENTMRYLSISELEEGAEESEGGGGGGGGGGGASLLASPAQVGPPSKATASLGPVKARKEVNPPKSKPQKVVPFEPALPDKDGGAQPAVEGEWVRKEVVMNVTQRIGWAIDQNTLEVVEVENDLQAHRKHIMVGSRVVAIGGVEVSTVRMRMRAYYAHTLPATSAWCERGRACSHDLRG